MLHSLALKAEGSGEPSARTFCFVNTWGLWSDPQPMLRLLTTAIVRVARETSDGVYTEPFDPSSVSKAALRTGFAQDRLRRSAQDEFRTGKVADRSYRPSAARSSWVLKSVRVTSSRA